MAGRHRQWSYIVLGCALVCESISVAFAVRAFVAATGTRNIVRKIIVSKNPATYTVIAEDTAAVLGLFIAAGRWLLTLDVLFDRTATLSDLTEEIDPMKSRIRERFPKLQKIYVDVKSTPIESHQ